MTEPCLATTDDLHTTARWSVAGLLLEAIATRDFTKLRSCLEPTATMRALLPRGAEVFEGETEIVAAFQRWFGGAEAFEVLDATVGEVGSRLHVSWRLRVDRTPRGDVGWHVIEQQLYLQATTRIDAVDLLCTGFLPDGATP